MIGSFARSVGAILLAIVVALFFATVVEVVSMSLYPFPAGADTSDCDVINAYLKELPLSGFLIGIVGWAFAAFTSSWTATRLGTARHSAHGIGIGLLLLAMAIMNMSMLEYPVYFWVSNLLLLPTSSVVATKLACKGRIAVANIAAAPPA